MLSVRRSAPEVERRHGIVICSKFSAVVCRPAHRASRCRDPGRFWLGQWASSPPGPVCVKPDGSARRTRSRRHQAPRVYSRRPATSGLRPAGDRKRGCGRRSPSPRVGGWSRGGVFLAHSVPVRFLFSQIRDRHYRPPLSGRFWGGPCPGSGATCRPAAGAASIPADRCRSECRPVSFSQPPADSRTFQPAAA